MSTEAGGQAVVRAQPVYTSLFLALFLHLLMTLISSFGFHVVLSAGLLLAWALMLLFKLRRQSSQELHFRSSLLLRSHKVALSSLDYGMMGSIEAPHPVRVRYI